MSDKSKLTFKVAPHIVEDLGLNLYTTLARVFVEFIANAYDADSSVVKLSFDQTKIKDARDLMRAEYIGELEKAKITNAVVPPLETRVLPDDISITIEDVGHGMSREDLNTKFLFAGRRRRREEPDSNGRTPGGRAIMGRKGLGKLAGFGVAKQVEVVSRKCGESHATRIVLDYDKILAKANAHEIDVEAETLSDGGGFKKSGTRITLSKLMYDPLKSRETTIQNEISEYFADIDPDDFKVWINNIQVVAPMGEFEYAWPDPDTLPIDGLVEKSLQREGGGQISFKYRIRFTGKEKALKAGKRGIRVYVRKRLAAAPSLMGADTNMHGFHTTDYLNGIVHADFIDEEQTDYISTDRVSLRWESPLLSGMYDFLSGEIKEACKNYQKKRDTEAPKIVENDSFTLQQINSFGMTGKDKKLALSFAVTLEKACKNSVNDQLYISTLPKLLAGIGHGTILAAISELSTQESPDINALVHELLRLSKDELDSFAGTVRARLKGIETLEKILSAGIVDKSRNEGAIQKLFEECSWLVDPTYAQFLQSADKSMNTLFKSLAAELKIDDTAAIKDGKEPDLVFLLGSAALKKVVIIELKASNIELTSEHLNQLEYYLEQTTKWLETNKQLGFTVHGQLIGTMPSPDSKARDVITLRRRIREAGAECPWKVRGFHDVVNDAKNAHIDMLKLQQNLEKPAAKASP